MKIKNLNGKIGDPCRCGDWLEHWKNFSKQDLPDYCPVNACAGRPEAGAHVQRDFFGDTHWFVVPMCRKHNAMAGQPLVLNDWIRLVSSDTRFTCG